MSATAGGADPHQLRGPGGRPDRRPPLPQEARHRQPDFTRGVAITSSVHPNDHTHIEPVRYGKGSNAMGAMSVLQVPYGGRAPRWLSSWSTASGTRR